MSPFIYIYILRARIELSVLHQYAKENLLIRVWLQYSLEAQVEFHIVRHVNYIHTRMHIYIYIQ